MWSMNLCSFLFTCNFFFSFFKQHEIGLIWHSLGAGLPLSLTFVERGDEGMKLWKTTFRLICIERAQFLIGCIHRIFAYRVANQATQVWDESRLSAPHLSSHSNVIPRFFEISSFYSHFKRSSFAYYQYLLCADTLHTQAYVFAKAAISMRLSCTVHDVFTYYKNTLNR